MARFDVFAISGSDQLVVDIQADILRDFHTRVVVPLMPVAAGRTEIAKRLRPIVTVGDCDYMSIGSQC